jgi:hypothetical protein
VKSQLFYHLTDPAGARARKLVMARGLLDRFKFRNLSYPEVLADLTAMADPPPLIALHDGTSLHSGEAAVIAAIEAMV